MQRAEGPRVGRAAAEPGGAAAQAGGAEGPDHALLPRRRPAAGAPRGEPPRGLHAPRVP
uniref:Uncharacterized protein n=1 Tax=Arundo donax TaxID=35708 RepID=A0A0A9DQL6_ARUDO